MECPECGKNFYGMQMMIQNVSVIFAASLICDFCPSDRSFAYSFLQIPSHDGHPCCSAIHFPLSGRVRDFHPLERAHGAQIITTSSAGGFLCGYKPVVLAGSKEPLKIRHAHSYHRQALKGFSLCLVYWLTRKRVYVLFQ